MATWLAFFALACQLFSGGSAAWAAAETGDASAGVPPSSPQKNPAGFAGDFCAICANISLAGTLILPILALILAPRLFTEVLQWSAAASDPNSFDHLPFNARGPPHG